MAINDNELYGLNGSQVKDLASRINAKGNVYYLSSPYTLDAGSDNLKNLCDFINESRAGKNCILIFNYGVYSGDPACNHISSGVRITKLTSSYAQITIAREFIENVNDGSTSSYGVQYYKTTTQDIYVYAPRSEYDNNNIQNLYSNTALTSRGITVLYLTGTTRSLINAGSVLGMTNNTAYTPTGDYNPSTKKYVDDKVMTGSTAPTTTTVGAVSQLYQDTTTGKVYICAAIIPGTAPDPDTYTWEEVGTNALTIREWS